MTEVERRLEVLILKYTPLIKSLIRKYATTDFHEMQDAYQEICLKLWEHIPNRYNPALGGSLFLYFKTRVICEARNYRKRRLPRRLKEYVPDIHDRCYVEHITSLDLRILADTPKRKKIVELALKGFNVTEMAIALKTSRSAVTRELQYFRLFYKEE